MENVETKGHTHKFENGIVHVYVKPVAPDLEIIQESIDVLTNYKKNNSRLLLFIDPTDAVALNSKQRKFATAKFEEIVDAMAMSNKNTFARLIFSLIVMIDKPKFPIRLVRNNQEALEWLESYKN